MSVKLSELVSNTTNDIYESPAENEMRTICGIVEKVDGAEVALRIQIEHKMSDYIKKKISEGEMYNVLVLTDFVAQKSPQFRTQVADLSFVSLLQTIGKMKKKHTKVSLVEGKVRDLIATWGSYYPNEMCEYSVLYKKYCSEEVINPMIQPTTFLPNEITKLLPHVEHNLRNISKGLEMGVGDLENIYKHATKINTKFQDEIAKIKKESNRYDNQKLNEIFATGDRLKDALKQLESELTKRNHHITDIDDVATSIKEGMFIRPTPRRLNVTIVPPPTSNKSHTVFMKRYDSPIISLTPNSFTTNNNNLYVNTEPSFDIKSHSPLTKTTSNQQPPIQNTSTIINKSISPNIFEMDEDIDQQHQQSSNTTIPSIL
ncbi:hypothetical protein ENUP19_0301G0006 [Entamoeba nuttalli]